MRPTFRSKHEVVYDTIRQAIIGGELQPGTRLVIDELSAELGVSAIPIREALRQLEADGFVMIEPYVGATVTGIHPDHISEIFALLEALEVISGRAACARMSDAELDELQRVIDDMEALVDDPEHWSQGNMALHQFICERAQTPLVQKMVQRTLLHWDRLRSYYLQDVFAYRVAAAQAEHRQMLAAMRARDPEVVETVIREHNRASLAAYTHHLTADAEGG